MKKFVWIGALAAVVALALGGLALAGGSKDYTGQACNDISGGDGAYTTFGGTEATVQWTITLTAPSCKQSVYTLHVLNGAADVSQALSSTGSSTVQFNVDMGPAATAPSSVCIFATSQNGKSISDRAPDSNCATLTLDGSPAGLPFH
jgi:hypothetical protein